MNGNNNPRVYVGIPSIEEDNLCLGQMLYQTLADLGFSPFIVGDGNPAALKSDVLLLVGDGRCFDGYAKLLSNCARTRPLTILWLIDPLPPPQFSERSRQIGLKLLKYDWRRLPPLWAKLIRAGLPLHHEMQKAARWMLHYKIKKDIIANNCPAYSEIGTHQFFILMTCFEWLRKNFERGWLDYVFTSTIQRRQVLKTVGIDAEMIPLGYHPCWGRKLSAERDIDVLFVGTLRSKRRRSILKDVEGKLSSKGIDIVKIDYGCYGEQRVALFNRAKIVLDIPRIPWEMPGMRPLMSMSCGALLICEYVKDTAPYKPGIHFVQAKATELSNAICHYIEHENERQAIVDSAYKFVTEKLTLRNSVLKIMQSCNIISSLPVLR